MYVKVDYPKKLQLEFPRNLSFQGIKYLTYVLPEYPSTIKKTEGTHFVG